MSPRSVSLLLLSFLLLGSHPALRAAAPSWPRKELIGGGVLIRYEPQIEAWHGYAMLQARQALSFRAKGKRRRVYGAVRFMAVTQVDHLTRTVNILSPSILEARFPSLDEEQARQAVEWLEQHFPQEPIAASLDAMLEMMADQQATRDEIEVAAEAPQLFQSDRPSALVLLDGPPVTEPVPGTDLEIVVNTDTPLLRDPRKGDYYLLLGEYWFRSRELGGRWESVRRLPQSFSRIPRGGFWSQIRGAVPARGAPPGGLPEIFVTQEEAELVQTQGRPRFEEIPGTGFSYLANSQADVFLERRSGSTYSLFSGRWFRGDPGSSRLVPLEEGPPEGLAGLAPEHPRGRVRVSIPGTPEAQEAAIAAKIPRFKRVPRQGGPEFQASYVGSPRFETVPGTGVEVAANTSYDIFRVGEQHLALHKGIWFEAPGPQGPWQVATSIPREIYSIPPEHPAHHVTYARLYGVDEDGVLAGYLPGYMGTLVSEGRVVHGVGSPVPRSPEFYRHAFQRRLEWWDQGALRADNPGRPFHLEPFYLRSFGYGFRYAPERGLFLPGRSGFTPEETLAEEPPPPATPRPPTPDPRDQPEGPQPDPNSALGKALRAALARGIQNMEASQDGTLYRRGPSGWEVLGPDGWKSTGVQGSSGSRPGTLGKLPTPESSGSSGEGKGEERLAGTVWPPPRSASGKGKGGVTAVGKKNTPKIAKGYDKYRWTNKLGRGLPVYRSRGYYGGYYGGGYYGGGIYPYYGPVFRGRGTVGTSTRSRTGAIGPVNTNYPSTFRSPTSGRPSLQRPFGRPTLQRPIKTGQ